MKKVDYKKMAMLGITGGLLMASQMVVAGDMIEKSGSGVVLAHGCGGGKCGGSTPTRNNEEIKNNPVDSSTKPGTSPTSAPQVPQTLPNQKGELADATNTRTSTATTQGHMTEADLRRSINAESREKFDALSPEGKALALQLANQACKGQNTCKGLNSCKTDHNSCAGQGGCKSQSKGPFTDKNLAVKVAAMKMASKRANATK